MLLDVGSISERQKNTLSFTLSLRTLWRICSSGYFLCAMSNEGRRWPIIAIATVLLNLLIFLESRQNFERAVAEYERLAAAYPAQKESLLALLSAGRICLRKLNRPADTLRLTKPHRPRRFHIWIEKRISAWEFRPPKGPNRLPQARSSGGAPTDKLRYIGYAALGSDFALSSLVPLLESELSLRQTHPTTPAYGSARQRCRRDPRPCRVSEPHR
jgi:hypothetical protein